MDWVVEIFRAVVATPLPTLLIVAGLVFLAIGVIGNISGRIEPGPRGRIASGVIGGVLFLLGFVMSVAPTPPAPSPLVEGAQLPTPTPTAQPPAPTATFPSTPTRTATATPTPAISPEDCLPYRVTMLRIVDEGANGWLLTDGASRMLVLASRQDAENALALARRHTAQCFIGRDNTRPNRKDYIVQYWAGDSGQTTAISPRDCLPYAVASLRIMNEGATGWALNAGSTRMALLDERQDAENALALARRHTAQCFIGRDNTRPNRRDYIVQYWE